ncbi:cytochrome P450 85A-like isoform X2 [Cucumis melo]|uniref:Cytochrome P450 85A-like n=1 Tax=Cucumis melo TaxID=3656 RepID=A0A1S3C1A8_CUCME|nr:cytochrome P450 85A-like isoform X2 [Cucumis melo]
MALAIVILALFLLLCFCAALFQWNEVRYRKNGLPPGTMGWPVFGETSEFLKQGPNFMNSKRARYGSFFKSHILGSPTVISMDPEVNRYILMNESKGLVAGYPQSMLDILGTCNIAAVHGDAHKLMRGALLAIVGPTMIKDRLLLQVDEFMRSHLRNWDSQIIDIQEKTKQMAFWTSLKQTTSIVSGPLWESFTIEFFKLVLGTFSLPIDLPGTNYRIGVQARNNIVKLLKKLISERVNSKIQKDDMLGYLLSEENKYKLNEEQIIDQIITVFYSGYETVSTTSMMAVKFLHDHPKVLQQLREEHIALREKKNPEDPIDWDDFKAMDFTRAVIFETSRLATVVNGVLRKTTKDLEVNGFLIPKGWRIYVYTREINYDPFLYSEPFTFNPWRWLDKNLESHNYFFLFGGGTRLCPGKELGIAEVSTFLHYFVTKYRWEEVGGCKLLKFPRVKAPNGFHIRVSSY